MCLPTVYPETANRSLESIEALFSTDSPFNWAMEKHYLMHGSDMVNDAAAEGGRVSPSLDEEKGATDSNKEYSHHA